MKSEPTFAFESNRCSRWPLTRLDEIVDAFSGQWGSDEPASGTRCVRILGVGNVTNSGELTLAGATERHLSENQLKAIACEGDLMVVKASGSASNIRSGKTAICPPELSGNIACSNFMIRLRVRRELAEPYLLWLILNSELAKAHVQKIVGASTYPNIKWETFRALEFPLPPLSEQKRIVVRLKDQMAKAARARASAEMQIGGIGSMFESCLRAAFCGIVPLSVGRDNATPPPDWQWLRLLDVARLESGHTPSRKHPDWWGGDVSWIALPDSRRLDCREVHETIERTNALGLANSSARLLPRGTVCLSRTASVGYVTIMGREMTTSQDFVNWVCGPELDPWFLLWALRAARDFIRAQSTGAIHQTVYMPVAKSFEICAPPVAEQHRIAERLREQFAEIERARTAATAQLDALKALPAALLREAFEQRF